MKHYIYRKCHSFEQTIQGTTYDKSLNQSFVTTIENDKTQNKVPNLYFSKLS